LVDEMATVLEMYTTEEQRYFVYLLWLRGLNAKDIHKEIFRVYVGKCLFTTGWQFSLMANRLKQRRGSSVDNSQKISMLLVSTH
jgi:hypothetical protein